MRTDGAARMRIGPWHRSRGIGLLIGLLLLVGVAAQLEPRDTDVAVYWKAAQRVFVQGLDPYPRRDGDQLPFTYPPTALVMLVPLRSLTLDQARTLLMGLNLILSLVAMVLIVGDLAGDGAAGPSRDPAGRRLALWGPIYIACYGGLHLNLVFYQVNLILLLLLWGYWRRVRLGRQGALAGAALVLGSIAKPHVGLLLAASAPRPGLRLILGLVATGALVVAISLWLAPADSWRSWLALVPGASSYSSLPDGHSSIAAPWNRSIAGQVARLLVPNRFTDGLLDAPGLAQGVSTSLVLATLAITGRALAGSMRRPDRPARQRDLELSLILIWVFLAAPASWTHHLVLLLPAALVLLRDGLLDPREPSSGRISAALVLLVLAATLDDLIPREVRTASQPLMSLMTVGVVALWLLLVQRLHRVSRGPTTRNRSAPGS